MNVDLLSSQSAAAVDRRETPEHHNDTESYNDASDDSYCTEDSYESSEDWWEEENSLLLFTCPDGLVHPLVHHLNRGKGLMEAWLCACQQLAGVHGLTDLKRLHPTALPSWLILGEPYDLLGLASSQGFVLVQPKLHVCCGNHVLFKNHVAPDTTARAAERRAQLERFRRCRFQEGFASEGMLCNSPLLPLGVLDHLEAADLLSLSLVCKATHRASHYLFRREFSTIVSGQEEVLRCPNIRIPQLKHSKNSAAARHRAMRAASLMCGRPESVNLASPCPNLLLNLVASPDACTQPYVKWHYWSPEDEVGLTEIVRARHVALMASRRCEISRVDPGGWPSRDQEALVELMARLRVRMQAAQSMAWADYDEYRVKQSLEGVGKVFETARRNNQVVVMCENFCD